MKPRVFVSSTFYDLKYIREDLSNFIKAHDFEPIMFEDGDIGYTPGKELDMSCYQSMRNADMVLLIIGGEYGSPASGENKDEFNDYISVTRKEFRTAAEEGIPIFVFIESGVYAEYGIYEMNIDNIEEGNVSIEFKATKSINIFRFIKEIRSSSERPVQEFKRSSDIKSFMSRQWADMFKQYLGELKQKKESVSIQNTVSDMETLIQKMNIMIEAVGKKLIGDDQQQYGDIVRRQNRLEVKRITQFIAENISVNVLNNESRKNNIKKLLSAIEKTYKDYGKGRFICRNKECIHDEEDANDMLDDYFECLARNISSDEMYIDTVKVDFLINMEDIVLLLENKEIRNDVEKQLMLSPFYNRIFQFRKNSQMSFLDDK